MSSSAQPYGRVCLTTAGVNLSHLTSSVWHCEERGLCYFAMSVFNGTPDVFWLTAVCITVALGGWLIEWIAVSWFIEGVYAVGLRVYARTLTLPKPNAIGSSARRNFKTRSFQFKVISRNEWLAYEPWRLLDRGWQRICKLKFTLYWNGDTVRIEGRVPVFALVASTVLLVGFTGCILSCPHPTGALMVLYGVAVVGTVLTLANQAGAARVMVQELAGLSNTSVESL
jgi:hypothetical protein